MQNPEGLNLKNKPGTMKLQKLKNQNIESKNYKIKIWQAKGNKPRRLPINTIEDNKPKSKKPLNF